MDNETGFAGGYCRMRGREKSHIQYMHEVGCILYNKGQDVS